MLTKTSRLKANQAVQEFAGQSLNGERGLSPPKGKAGCYTGPSKSVAATRTDDEAYSGNSSGQGQVNQSRNGNGQHESPQWRSGPIIKLVRYGDMPFTQVLQATVRDHRLSPGARWLLIFLLSQPKDWQPLKWRIEKETGQSSFKLTGWMGELCKYGYGRIEQVRSADGRRAIGSRWLVCEFPNQSWLAERANSLRPKFSESQKIDAYKNDRLLKNERIQSKRTSDRSHAARSGSFDLSDYSEDEQEAIELYHAILCDKDRSWRRVNQYAESVCEVIEMFFTSGAHDAEEFFRAALAASQCECEEHDCKHCSAVSIPRRDESRTLVNLAWKNY
jgi:hypothetical protein